MASKPTPEFRAEAMRVAPTSAVIGDDFNLRQNPALL